MPIIQPTKRYYSHTPAMPCSVDGCDNIAEYEVYLYDFYPNLDEEFFEQDFTCPFICKPHMDENESRASGVRQSRGYVEYPFTNQGHAQGYSKYQPLDSVFVQIVAPSLLIPSIEVISAHHAVNASLVKELRKNPELLRQIEPRRFEELIAHLFAQQGFRTELTQRTRDGGKDVYAAKKDGLGTSLYLIECKRYAESNKVGVDTVRSLYGVLEQEKATKGIVATTSSFTSDAISFAKPIEFRLSLQDYEGLKSWLNGNF